MARRKITAERNFKDIPWIEFSEFNGYRTDVHRSHKKARGYLVDASRSVVVNEDGSISPRLGYSIYGAGSTATTPIKTLMKFRPRTGNEILLRTYSTVIEYYSSHSSAWETLLTAQTTGLVHGWKQMDYAPFASPATETSLTDYTFVQKLYFGNGTDGARSWNGATAKLASATANTIVIDSTVNISALVPTFDATGKVVVNGTEYTYSGYATKTFTISSGNPSAEAVGSSIAQITEDESAGQPAGNIYHKTDNARLMMAGKPAVPGGVYVSKINDPEDFTFSTTRVATDGSVINVGSLVKAFEQLGDKIYHLGPEFIGWLKFTQEAQFTGSYDLIEIRPEVEGYDVGPTNELATAKWDNKVMYASQNAIKDLGSVISHNTFQVEHISDKMAPTFETLDLSSAALSVFQNKLYVACKKTSSSSQNDIVQVYDILDQQWEAPRNLNVSSWVVTNGNLYAGNSINPTVSQMEVADQHLDADSDGTSAVTYSIAPKAELWQENFGLPFQRKTLYGAFLEGEINEGSILSGKIYLDEDGYSGTLEFQITGTQEGIIFKSSNTNTFAMQSFAMRAFAVDEESAALNYFRVEFCPRSISHFYVINLEVSSATEATDNDNWKIRRIGFKVDRWLSEHSQIKIDS